METQRYKYKYGLPDSAQYLFSSPCFLASEPLGTDDFITGIDEFDQNLAAVYNSSDACPTKTLHILVPVVKSWLNTEGSNISDTLKVTKKKG